MGAEQADDASATSLSLELALGLVRAAFALLFLTDVSLAKIIIVL